MGRPGGAVPPGTGRVHFFAIIGILDTHLPADWFPLAFEPRLNQNDAWLFFLARHFVDNGLLVAPV